MYAKGSLGTRKRKRWISSASASLGEQSREGDRSRFQRLAWGLAKVAGASALVLAAFIVALPSILSTKAGLRCTLAVVNRFVPGEIAITQASLGWRKPVNIENVQWGDRASEAAGGPLVEVPSIRSSASLWDIAKGRECEVLISNPRVDGSLTDDGTFLLQQVAQGKPASRAQAQGKAEGDAQVVRFAAEGKFLSGHIFVSDGVIHGLPSAAKEVVGNDLHLTAIVGAKQLKTDGAEYNIEAEWVDHTPKPPKSRNIGKPLEPTVVKVASEHINAQLNGWRTAEGLILHEPITASFTYTPALAKYGFAKVAPLLTHVAAVEEGGLVSVTVTPDRMELPSERMAVRVEPLKLKIGRGPLLGKAIEFLASQGGGGVGQRGSLLQAQTSAIQVDVLDSSSLETQRLDLLVGGSTRGLHLATWGKVDPKNDQISMWLGFPAASLSRLGLKGLPREAMLPIAVQGSLHQPRVKWLDGYRKVAALASVYKPAASEGTAEIQPAAAPSLRKSVFQEALQSMAASEGASAEEVEVPPPIDRVLPWETVQEDGSIVSTVSEDADGDGILSAVVGTLGHLVRKAASALGRKLHII
ncbi:g4145 [Coccomyxa elongata]